MKSKTKHFFKQMQGHVRIPFFGCAFAVECVWSRHCVLGPKYYKSRVSSVPEHLEDHVIPRKRLRIMDTRKCNCPATLNMKCIRVYPDYHSMHSATEHRDTKAKLVSNVIGHQKKFSYGFLAFSPWENAHQIASRLLYSKDILED
ncbi:uncharacterized protein LOC124792973 isoform X1 [Schistocerca piceifrons]|uniref:uncharacterized protein LOC124792973 isoform X1 n=1 Tax=Schistocerca piceifrons TaxID=274613 RepID=UPI001F5F3D35|nr:uncharacterized protein LOC124792973 isoform X1 [Schistocerca piceifrons]